MEPEKKSNGALVGLIIIVIILVVGGIYIWQVKNKAALEEKNVNPQDSSELDTLEQDLNSTDTNVDVNFDTIE